MKKDGSKKQELFSFDNEAALCLNVVGDWIYFSSVGFDESGSICKIKTDGSEHQKLIDDFAVSLTVVDDWIYCAVAVDPSDDNSIYKMKTDGTERQKLSDDTPFAITVTDGWIYYSFNNKIYRIKTDGSERQELGFTSMASSVIATEDWVYYYDRDYGLCRIKTDASNPQRLTPENSTPFNMLGYFHVVDEWIYFSSNDLDSNTSNFYKMKADGSDPQKLSDFKTGISGIQILDDWIYFSSYEGSTVILNRIKIDGTEQQVIDSIDIDPSLYY